MEVSTNAATQKSEGQVLILPLVADLSTSRESTKERSQRDLCCPESESCHYSQFEGEGRELRQACRQDALDQRWQCQGGLGEEPGPQQLNHEQGIPLSLLLERSQHGCIEWMTNDLLCQRSGLTRTEPTQHEFGYQALALQCTQEREQWMSGSVSSERTVPIIRKRAPGS
jgi:hypothetical protein